MVGRELQQPWMGVGGDEVTRGCGFILFKHTLAMEATTTRRPKRAATTKGNDHEGNKKLKR
jgi:hypothetical protein